MSRVRVADTLTTWATGSFSTAASAPTNVVGTAGNTTATLTWDAPSDLGGSQLTGYRVGRDGTDSTGFGAWSTVVTPTTHSWTFAKLVNSSQYNIYVEAITALHDPGTRSTVAVTPTGTPPVVVAAKRTLGVFKGGFPQPTAAGSNSFLAAFESQMVGGATIRLAETFYNSSLTNTSNIGGEKDEWLAWLNQGNRRAVLSVGPVPKKGPDGAWTSDKGTDDQVSAALVRGANGEFDHHWTQFGKNLSGALGNTIIRVAWEFNGGWYPFRAGANPTAFVAYYRRIVERIKEQAPNVLIDWNLAGGGQGGQKLVNGSKQNVGHVDLAYPGNDYVDIMGIDIYDQHGSKTKAEAWSTITGPSLETHRQYAASKGKPMSIPEWGTWGHFTRVPDTDPVHQRYTSRPNTVDWDNDTYINNMHSFIEAEANNVLYHVYFDVSAHDANHRLTQTPDTEFPNARAAFIAKTWRTAL